MFYYLSLKIVYAGSFLCTPLSLLKQRGGMILLWHVLACVFSGLQAFSTVHLWCVLLLLLLLALLFWPTTLSHFAIFVCSFCLCSYSDLGAYYVLHLLCVVACVADGLTLSQPSLRRQWLSSSVPTRCWLTLNVRALTTQPHQHTLMLLVIHLNVH